MLNHSREPQNSSENYGGMWLTLGSLHLWALNPLHGHKVTAVCNGDFIWSLFRTHQILFQCSLELSEIVCPPILLQLMSYFYFTCQNVLTMWSCRRCSQSICDTMGGQRQLSASSGTIHQVHCWLSKVGQRLNTGWAEKNCGNRHSSL